ncbi:MAG: DHH family phosphoesterase [Alkalinema sp. CAN_BIN05]|nr:DHH family phosphoesterase [Alkalinema sp. CAN_BIN05]
MMPPADFTKAISAIEPNPYLAPLLWQRGHRDIVEIRRFLNIDRSQSGDPLAFGYDMKKAVQRIKHAAVNKELVALWSDPAPDGIATTALLWEGLQLGDRLFIVQPDYENCLRGLSITGLDRLKIQGITLVITCDTGSHNALELNYAKSLGIDIIIIDHHTDDRPNVTNVIHLNSRHLDQNHSCATLPSVAIAYKLIEALQGKEQTNLLDIVAIGMLADLVEYKGEARALFQKSIPQLQLQVNPKTSTRPGIQRLLKHCRNHGDRATEFNSGLGARIQALSQIQPEICLKLLTTDNPTEATTIADRAELSYTRSLGLHKEILDQVLTVIQTIDLSTSEAMILANPQWNFNTLTSVAKTIEERFQKPTFLFSTEDPKLVKGVGRSAQNLYDLLKPQMHLLHRLGGHPNSVSLSLQGENLVLFIQAIDHHLRLHKPNEVIPPIDLCVTVAELGEELYKALRYIEPCGIGNPVPRLRLRNVQFDDLITSNIKDSKQQRIAYLQTQFKLYDNTKQNSISGSWSGHSQDDIPKGLCDAIVYLENNVQKHRYEVRLVECSPVSPIAIKLSAIPILDWRTESVKLTENVIRLTQCPSDWNTLKIAFRRAIANQQPLALDYRLPMQNNWSQLIGIAKYLARTGEHISPQHYCDRLLVSATTFQIGLEILRSLGFKITNQQDGLQISPVNNPPTTAELTAAESSWTIRVREERFRQQYFAQVSLTIVQAFLSQDSSSLTTL